MKAASLYIHIAFCISKCAYCDFFSVAQEGKIPDEYINALCNEIAARGAEASVTSLKTIYIGGGTPSLLNSQQLQKIFNQIRKSFLLDEDCEISVEVNPDDVNLLLLESLSSCGVNRISCGIQSLSDAALKKACRRADSATCRKALELLKNKWRGQLSLDLISALPEESESSFLSGLEEIISFKPSHISMYSLTIEENTPFGKMLSRGQLSYDYDKADQLWLSGRDLLESKGYKWYEVSNFCLTGKECRHNLSYWKHESYLGCGSGGCGTIYDEDGSGFRWTNTTEIKKYIDFWTSDKLPYKVTEAPCVNERIELETSKFEFFMMGLRKLSGVSEAEYKSVFNEPFPSWFLQPFREWEEKGLCRFIAKGETEGGEGRYAMSRQGILFLNTFLEKLI